MPLLKFPTNFLWGTATSSYQIEGSTDVDGRKPSIWDLFCQKPKSIMDGSSGNEATDHYIKWEEDISLLQRLKVKSYRFSIAWPRIFPEGSGKPNLKGVLFYHRLIDALLSAGIVPMVTLYHWDLPQALQEKGGWLSRDTSFAFAEFARFCFLNYKDRVPLWITHNEPWIVTKLGHQLGIHAPGIQKVEEGMLVAHHLLLSHGLAIQKMKSIATDQKIGIALNLNPVHAENPDRKEDVFAAKQYDLFLNEFFLRALFIGSYPTIFLQSYPILAKGIHQKDMAIIKQDIDFLGINYYTRTIVNEKGVVDPIPNSYSSMWEFYPQGLKNIVERVWNSYPIKEIFITENGTALANLGTADDNRSEYIKAHLLEIHRLITKSIRISGYYVWSLLDNFEWTYGYKKRFGLVHVDFTNYKRKVKASGYWYAKVTENNGIEVK